MVSDTVPLPRFSLFSFLQVLSAVTKRHLIDDSQLMQIVHNLDAICSNKNMFHLIYNSSSRVLSIYTTASHRIVVLKNSTNTDRGGEDKKNLFSQYIQRVVFPPRFIVHRHQRFFVFCDGGDDKWCRSVSIKHWENRQGESRISWLSSICLLLSIGSNNDLQLLGK